MSRLIDADKLMERLERKKCEPAKVRYTEGYNDALMRFRSMVHGAPTVDAMSIIHAHLVRCKECKHRTELTPTKWHPCIDMAVNDDWFCADGERINDAESI